MLIVSIGFVDDDAEIRSALEALEIKAENERNSEKT